MPLIFVAVTLIIVGVLLWVANAYVPMDGKIKKILNIVIVWLSSVFGILGHSGDIKIPQVR
jgi:hypothetical protein